MLLLSWGVVAAAELWCPAATVVMDMRLPSSWYQTVSAVLSRVGVEGCVYIPSRLTCWYQALNLGPLQHCDFSRWCKRLTQAYADTHDGWRQHGDTDSLLPGAPGCLLSDAPDSLPAECNKASRLFMITLQQIPELQVFSVASHEYQETEHAGNRVRSRCMFSAVTY